MIHRFSPNRQFSSLCPSFPFSGNSIPIFPWDAPINFVFSLCLFMFSCTMCMRVTVEAKRGCWTPEAGVTGSWATGCGYWRPASARAASTLNHWHPSSHFPFLILSFRGDRLVPKKCVTQAGRFEIRCSLLALPPWKWGKPEIPRQSAQLPDSPLWPKQCGRWEGPHLVALLFHLQ